MNHLLRELAPIGDAAWALIEDEAKNRLVTYLAGRKLVDFSGPHGWERSAVDLGRVEESGEHSAIALALDPVNTAAIVHMGWQLIEEGRYTEAVLQYREALRLDPSYTEARIHLLYIGLLTGRPADAEEEWGRIRVLAEFPDSAWFRGMIAAHAGRSAEASKFLAAASVVSWRPTRRWPPTPSAWPTPRPTASAAASPPPATP